MVSTPHPSSNSPVDPTDSSTGSLTGALTGTTADKAIVLEGVYKSFGRVPILRNINLSIDAGEFVVLLGASGCGKTTLLRCMNGLETIDSGSVIIHGDPLYDKGKVPSGFNMNEFRSQIGMVFQQFNLFPHLTVMENITLAPVRVLGRDPDEVFGEALNLLERVGLGDKAIMYPTQLSGGQKQRVAIARSLAMNPKILLFDEPTSALDPLMTEEVLSVIKDVATQGITCIIVTHEFHFARRVAHRCIVMERGTIVESGKPDELLQNPQHSVTQNYMKHFQPDSP